MAQTNNWIKATASGDGDGCLEFANADGKILMRDSKLGDASPVLEFTPHEIHCFLDGRAKGEFVEKLGLLS